MGKIPFRVGDLVRAPLWNGYTKSDLGVGEISRVINSSYVSIDWERGEEWLHGRTTWLEHISPLERLARAAE